MGSNATLTIHLFSFSYRKGGAPRDPSGHGGGFVFDCRALPNPYWEEALRPYSGLDTPVAAFMEGHEMVADFAAHAGWLVVQAAETYAERGYERLMVAFGCTGGRHRSVYQAELLAKALKAKGYAVELLHRELDGPGGRDSAGGGRNP